MNKRFALLLAVVMLVCAVACAAAEPVAEPVADCVPTPFTLQINGVPVTSDDLSGCPAYTVTAESVNSSGTAKSYVYVGYALSDVLALVGVTDGYTKLEATADDGYTIACDAELAAQPTTLVAFLRDGEPFKNGPWFAPCGSATTGDYLKNTASLTVDAEVKAVEAQPEPETADAPAGLPEIQDRTEKVTFAPYSFLVNGAAVTNETLAGLRIYKISVSVTNSKGETVEATYTGYKLADVLAACGVGETDAVSAVANDGYESALDAATVQSDYTLVAIEKDKETGEDGTVWVAPCEATESKAYAKLVIEIKAE